MYFHACQPPSADKFDGVKKMSNPFVDDRVDTPIEKWYAGHTIVQDTIVQDEVLVSRTC